MGRAGIVDAAGEDALECEADRRIHDGTIFLFYFNQARICGQNTNQNDARLNKTILENTIPARSSNPSKLGEKSELASGGAAVGGRNARRGPCPLGGPVRTDRSARRRRTAVFRTLGLA
eukprot:scaffold11920_cov108-Isochrysis_galbana.AAC.2